MDDMKEETWTVTMKVFSFDSKESAETYINALIDAFCKMPESEHLGSIVSAEQDFDE